MEEEGVIRIAALLRDDVVVCKEEREEGVDVWYFQQRGHLAPGEKETRIRTWYVAR